MGILGTCARVPRVQTLSSTTDGQIGQTGKDSIGNQRQTRMQSKSNFYSAYGAVGIVRCIRYSVLRVREPKQGLVMDRSRESSREWPGWVELRPMRRVCTGDRVLRFRLGSRNGLGT